MSRTKVTAIIPAAGMGSRLGVGYNKQYIELDGKPMVVRTIETISKNSDVIEVIWVVGEQEIELAKGLVKEYQLHKVKHVVAGGKERVYSVINGYLMADNDSEYLLVHDGARPLITPEIIIECIQKASEIGAAIVAVPVKDTIKVSTEDGKQIVSTPPRSILWAAQTPQIMKKEWFAQAIQGNLQLDTITDDSMLMEKIGKPVAIVKGSYENIKVTTPEDVDLAETILCRRRLT